MSRLVIEAGQADALYWKDLWKYRELFFFLSWRDVLVRYKQTAIGVVWAFIRPVLTTIIFTVVFGKLAKMPSGDVPYPVLVYAGMLPWQFFASALSDASNSLVGNANMISKIYFPRLIIPASAVIVGLVDFLISAVILIILMLWYHIMPTPRLFFLVPLTGVALVAAFGAGVWLAALNVKYRDFRFIVPFIVQFGLFASPIGYSSDIVPEKWRFWYSLNPMVGVIDGFRWAVGGGSVGIYWPGFALSMALVVALFLSGIWHFRKTEKAFADII